MDATTEISGEFAAEMRSQLGSQADELLAALGRQATVAVRLNGLKPVPGRAAVSGDRVPWCPRGFYLPRREQFTFDPLFHAGAYYVQDASSMIVWHIVRSLTDGPVRYLDLCAAPGGKSTAAIDALRPGSLVLCNEVVPARARILVENITKWGTPGCVVTSSGAEAFGSLGGYFDVIAADVPCSGEGMMRKDEEAVAQWSPALVRQCAARQREIVAGAWPALRQGGFFIYSTCAFNRHENEEIVDFIISELGAESVELDLPPEWGVCGGLDTSACCCRFMPHRTRGEGLFVAVLRKTSPSARPSASRGKCGRSAQVPGEVKEWLSGDYCYVSDGDSRRGLAITAIPAGQADDVMELRSRLKVLSAGVELARLKGRDLVPAHALALSAALNRGAFPLVEVDYPTAAAYLRGETVAVDAPRGHVAITFRGLPLGFVKNLGGRANNLYPRPWRVRGSHVPDLPPEVI